MCVKNEKIITSRLLELKGDMNVSSFAKKCGIKQPVMDRYLNRGYEPKIDQMILICRAHGCSLDWLVGMSNVKEPNVALPESEWQKRAVAAEHELKEYDGFIDLVMRGHEEMLKGIHGIVKIRDRKSLANDV